MSTAPTSGRLSDEQLAEFRNRRVGFVFQFASLLPTLRVIDNVALPALLGRRRGRGEAYARAARCWSSWASPNTSMRIRRRCRPASNAVRLSPER